MRDPSLLASGLAEVSPTLHERWLRKVDLTKPMWACWEWTGSTFAGYGRMKVGRRVNGGQHALGYAHRVSYWLNVGEIPAGMHIDHMCHNPSCVNPHHLRVATPKENTHNSDISCAGRTHCPQGHPYAGDNLYVWRDKSTGQVRRYCRTCSARYVSEWRARNRKVAA